MKLYYSNQCYKWLYYSRTGTGEDLNMCIRYDTYCSKCHLVVHHGEKYLFKVTEVILYLFSEEWGSGDSWLKNEVIH